MISFMVKLEGKNLYGLIGYPLKHSYSPLMHNYALKYFKLEGEYKLFPLIKEELPQFINSIGEKNIKGFNVTIPHKEVILDFIDEYGDQFSKEIKAVNTVVVKNERLIGFNTDILGFKKHIREYIDLREKRVVVLGAGGASRAVCYVLAQEGINSLDIFDIDKSKSFHIKDMLEGLNKHKFPIKILDNIEDLDLKDKDVLINATPVGMRREDPIIVPSYKLHSQLFVYDLIYNPQKTKLLECAESNKARISNGLGMLIYQAAYSFKYFTGIGNEVDEIIEVMKGALECGKI